MRYSQSLNFVLAAAKQRAAYAVYDRFAEAGTDNTPEGEEASRAEYEALDAVLLTPCRHPGDVAAKLALIERREVLGRDDGPRIMASLIRDLKWLSRPGASAEMQAAWARWACCHAACQTVTGEDDASEAVCDNHSAAFRALMAVPCTTAGDFLVKIYVELVSSLGTTERDEGGYHFELRSVDRLPGTDYLEDAAQEAALNDLQECDLGRCMMMLGSLEFDGSAWVRAALRVGLEFQLVIGLDGKRSFSMSGLSDSPLNPQARQRQRMVRALLCFDDGRLADVGDEIEDHYPGLVTRDPAPFQQEVA